MVNNSHLPTHLPEHITQTDQWHPKLTPYRLLVLLTTAGLGTAKAYSVSQQLSSVATSIEWVSGVVIFSIFYIINLYEPNPPNVLKWLVTTDLVHTFFRMRSQPPPHYRSDELTNSLRAHHDEFVVPPITGYRLLTTMSVTLFGIAKAYFTYQNISAAANAFDWSFGVIMTTCLYILGLYENNPVNLMPYFFSASYSAGTYHTLWLTIHMIGISVSLVAIRFIWSSISSGLPLPNIPEGLKNRGTYLFFIAFFLLFCLFVVVLSLRLLRFCGDHSPAILHNCFPSLALLWRNVKSSRSPLINFINRIHRRGAGALIWFIGSLFSTGLALIMMDSAISHLRPIEGNTPPPGYWMQDAGAPLSITVTLLYLCASAATLFMCFAYLLEWRPFR